jgi:hypothetical protein
LPLAVWSLHRRRWVLSIRQGGGAGAGGGAATASFLPDITHFKKLPCQNVELNGLANIVHIKTGHLQSSVLCVVPKNLLELLQKIHSKVIRVILVEIGILPALNFVMDFVMSRL